MDYSKQYDELDDILISMLRIKKLSLISSFLASTKIIFIPDGSPHTNGKEIYMPVDMWDNWDAKTKAGVLIHEVLHIMLQHIPTAILLDLNHRKANFAGDYQINLMVKDFGLTLPDGTLYDVKFRDMGFEEIYKIIDEPDEDYEPDWEMPDSDDPDSGDDGQAPSQVDAAEQIKDEIDRKLIEAAVVSEISGGDLSGSGAPSELLRRIQELRNPKLPWNVLLRKFFNSRFGKTKTSFAKRNRRFPNAVVPTKSSMGMGKVSFYEDLSGSITQKEHSLQVAEMQYIQLSMEPEEITYNGFTHELDKTQYFSRGRPMMPDWNITGGTNIKPVLEDILVKNPQVAIIFTDGYFYMPNEILNQIVNTEIIWVIVNNPEWTANKGEVLHMEIK